MESISVLSKQLLDTNSGSACILYEVFRTICSENYSQSFRIFSLNEWRQRATIYLSVCLPRSCSLDIAWAKRTEKDVNLIRI